MGELENLWRQAKSRIHPALDGPGREVLDGLELRAIVEDTALLSAPTSRSREVLETVLRPCIATALSELTGRSLHVVGTVRPSAPTVLPAQPVCQETTTGGVWAAVGASRQWLDAANGCDPHELTCRILKVTEEAGEAAGAWIGVLGQNPRKGVHATREDVAAELADVVITALVAISSLGLPAEQILDACASKVLSRIGVPA